MLANIIDVVKRTKIIIMDVNKKSAVTIKGYGNYVTKVDFEVQTFLKNELHTLYPDIQFMGEEEATAVTFENNSVWILDPIDGTSNLIHNLNQSAVSLGLVANFEPILGVVYNPFSDELFYAEKGKGAYFNGRPISVSKKASLQESLISFGTAPYDKALADDVFSSACEIYKRCEDLRRFGAAALELCYLASGRTDGFFERNLKPWDYAAGAAILNEAGGKITNYSLGPVSFETPDDIIASNGKIHDELYSVLHL